MQSEYYNELLNNYGKRHDRYANCNLLEDKETGEVLVSTREIGTIPIHPNDRYHKLKATEMCRLDLIAYQYYSNPLLWWVIAQANEIYDPMKHLEIGTVLRIPSIETLYGNRGILL